MPSPATTRVHQPIGICAQGYLPPPHLPAAHTPASTRHLSYRKSVQARVKFPIAHDLPKAEDCNHLPAMAEAMAIIGLVSNIISFINFGLKLASRACNVCELLHGTSIDIYKL